MSTDNPETNKAADRLVASIKEYFHRIEGKVLNSKEILEETTKAIKRRLQ